MAVYEWDVTISYLIITSKKKGEKDWGTEAPELKVNGSVVTRWPERRELQAAAPGLRLSCAGPQRREGDARRLPLTGDARTANCCL